MTFCMDFRRWERFSLLRSSCPASCTTGIGFYPEITDGCKRADSFRSCLATLRRILGLCNRSMYFEHISPGGIGCRIRHAVDPRALEQAEEAFARRVVTAMAHRAHRAHQFVGRQVTLVVAAPELAAAIGMGVQPRYA